MTNEETKERQWKGLNVKAALITAIIMLYFIGGFIEAVFFEHAYILFTFLVFVCLFLFSGFVVLLYEFVKTVIEDFKKLF